jgi:hypothetical protein
MPSHIATAPHTAEHAPECFRETPYLATVFAPDVHHVILLPSAWDASTCMAVAMRQMEANQLVTLMALRPTLGVYLTPGRAAIASADLLPSRLCFTERVAPAFDAATAPGRVTPEDAHRDGLLAAFAARHAMGRGQSLAVLPTADLLPAAPADVVRLTAADRDGTPRDLAPCVSCHGHAGVGLWRADEATAAYVVNVACACDVEHRCAACRQPLHPRGLNRFSWDAALGRVMFVGAVMALQHRCP